MEGREPDPGSPHDLIRIGITLAAVSIALAALQADSPIVPWFLLSGLAATLGTGYAMAQVKYGRMRVCRCET
jgi:hypothetical protein